MTVLSISGWVIGAAFTSGIAPWFFVKPQGLLDFRKRNDFAHGLKPSVSHIDLSSASGASVSDHNAFKVWLGHNVVPFVRRKSA